MIARRNEIFNIICDIAYNIAFNVMDDFQYGFLLK